MKKRPRMAQMKKIVDVNKFGTLSKGYYVNDFPD